MILRPTKYGRPFLFWKSLVKKAKEADSRIVRFLFNYCYKYIRRTYLWTLENVSMW